MKDLNLDPVLSDCNPPPLNSSDEIIIFSTRSQVYYTYVYSLMAHEFSEQGIASLFLFKQDQLSAKFPTLTINDLCITNSFYVKDQYDYGHRDNPQQQVNWNVNFAKKTIHPKNNENLNIFAGLRATLQQLTRRYTLDYSSQKVQSYTKKFLNNANLALLICQHLKLYAQNENKTIYLAGWDTSYPLRNIFFEYCRKLGDDYLQLLEIRPAYDSYFFGDSDKFGHTITVTNYTKRESDFDLSGHIERFNTLLEKYKNDEELRESVKSTVDTLMENNILPGYVPNEAFDENQSELPKVVDDFTNRNRDVFCLFSHVFFDRGLSQYSPLYSNMFEWIDHTIEIFSERDDLLIIKPHPSMIGFANEEDFPNQTIKSVFGEKINTYENIILLNYLDYKASEIYQLIDCGLIWESSVGMEMSYLSIPVIATHGDPYYSDYVPLNYVDDRDEYKKYIEKGSSLQVNQNLLDRVYCAYYFLMADFHAPFPYIKGVKFTDKEFMKKNIGWDRKKLDEYLENGNKKLKKLIKREIEETFEYPGLLHDEDTISLWLKGD